MAAVTRLATRSMSPLPKVTPCGGVPWLLLMLAAVRAAGVAKGNSVGPPRLPQTPEEALARVGDGRTYLPPPTANPHSTAQPPPHHYPSKPKTKVKLRPSGPSINITVSVNAPQGRYTISPGVYGVNAWGNFRDPAVKAANRNAGIRLVRQGGNPYSRYNWMHDTANRCADWFFETIPASGPGQPSSFDTVTQGAFDIGAQTVATVPMLGWLPKARAQMCSFNVKKYGPQTNVDPWFQDCGNGISNATKQFMRAQNDRTDAAMFMGPDFQQKWIQYLVGKFGSAASGGVRYYCLDNEPVWWSYRHQDIHWNASTYNEIFSLGLQYAAAIKQADPGALVMGPVSGGWADIFYSITDMESGWHHWPTWRYWDNPVDRRRHGGAPFLQWYLEGFAAYEMAYGQRIIDIVDFHAYIAGSASNDNSDAATQAQRIAATRLFWDPNFVCGSSPLCNFMDGTATATDGVPRMITRVQDIIDAAYQGLGIAITEYSFGGRFDASGAVAQAELLGVFGKYNVSVAAVLPGPSPDTTVYQAFKMYGNYDGRGSSFGSQGVPATSQNYTAVSAYAAVNSFTNKLTVLLINLTPLPQQVDLLLADVLPTQPIGVFRYDSGNLTAILPLDPLPPSQWSSLVLTGYSLTMLEVPLA